MQLQPNLGIIAKVCAMEVFKFGGASVRNAEGVRNLAKIINRQDNKNLLIVVSAMGKTTNCLELLIDSATDRDKRQRYLDQFTSFHHAIIDDLFEHPDSLEKELTGIKSELEIILDSEMSSMQRYDEVVSKGELISTRIIYKYLADAGISVKWIDARKYIITDDHHMAAHVHWGESERRIRILEGDLNDGIILTQGFIGGTQEGMTTTLGREGSDYSAAIFATCLNASAVTVWKDVNGIMNGDPKRIPDTVKYDELPYTEAAEMTYYGASVIHPKTIKPLANLRIPLYVKSFFTPEDKGTIIHECSVQNLVPAVIIKDNQCLVSFHVRDFTFINERNVSLIFHELSEADLKINLMQNSAISLSIIMDYHPADLEHIIRRLKPHFSIKYNTSLELLTIKNYNEPFKQKYREGREILLEQISRNNYRAVMTPVQGHAD